ncbi:MAG TPA: UvrD-helicase domain-containing protein [Candidatus Saccharimonadales bacterium]|nr:UvrD-helicase domain-containing protein [Candidatus Saccharimonadales bacterium]
MKAKKSETNPNINQQEAINLESGALLVVAGAGTGKTRVITERIKHLIQNKKVGSNNILALTFTDKACSEMVGRVDEVMPLGYEDPWICTFHSFAERILRAEGLEIGLDISYKVLTEPQQWILLRKNLYKLDLNYYRPLGNPTKFISAILKFISRLKDEDISRQDLENFAKKFDAEDQDEKKRWTELAYIYKRYEEIKLESSKLDFGDLIVWVTKLFRERPNILKKYRKQFEHVLIDEFQDTNFAQYELIKLLFPASETANKNRSLLVVGDDSQSIYKFRGAAVSNILEFRKDYPESNMITLLNNYRSGQEILDPAYKLIKNNDPDTLEVKLNISKKLVSMIDEKAAIVAASFETLEDEVEFVISKILGILAKEPQYTYKNFAILARANSHLDPFILGLRKHGLPYQLVGNRGLYDREEIRDIMSLLKIIINPLDTISLYRVLNISTLQIPHENITAMLSQSKYKNVPLCEIIKENKNEKVMQLCKIILEFQDNLNKATPTQITYNAVNAINYTSQFIKEPTVDDELKLKNLDLFLNIVKRFEVDHRQETKNIPTLIDFIDYITLVIEAGENPAQAEIEDIDTINLLTVHASKGLEFGAAFMVNLVADRFPTRDRGDTIEVPDELIKETLPTGNEHLQEERRLFYVGMTRAKKYLYLTFAKNYGGKREKVESGFINETGIKTTIPEAKTEQSGLFGIGSGFREAPAEKIKSFVPDFLSYTQISTYETCPLQYKYAYILKIPTLPNHALSFGSSIHNTLRDFHTKLMFNENVSYEDLLKLYQNNWQPLGYDDEDHRNLQFKKGEELLKKYYEENKNNKNKTMALEKSFNIRIDGIKFYGRIDRIDTLPDGNIEIIDYKTGSAKDQKEVDKDAQVAYYAMGASEALQLKPEKLTMYFIEHGKKISTTRTEKQIKEKKEEIKQTVAKMKQGNFTATPGMHCNYCDYNAICPYRFKG